jgi:hypothetical protein
MEGTVSTDRQQDAGLDRLVRVALRGEVPPEGSVCPDADVIAAYTDGSLASRERTDLEPHLAACQRCQAVIAMLGADADAEAARPHAAAEPAWPGSWIRRWRVAWFVPAGAAALAVVLYIATKPDATPSASPDDSARSAAGSPERTLAKAADTAASPSELPASLAEPQGHTRALGRSETATGTVNELKAAAAAKSETALALAEQALPSPAPAAPATAIPAPAPTAPAATLVAMAPAQPSRADAAAGAAAGNVAMAAPQEAREKPVGATDALDAAAPSLDALWRRADLVVVGRIAASAVGGADKRLAGAAREAADTPGFDVVIVESLKPSSGATLDHRVLVLSAPAGAIRMEPGAEYVLFLTRAAGANTPIRFTTVGAAGIVPLQADRAGVLTQLRRLADAQRR